MNIEENTRAEHCEVLLPWGVRIRLREDDFITHWVRHSGVFDAPVTECILRLTEAGETAIDVGAHVGHMSAAMARACGSCGHVVAFEPCAENYQELLWNVRSWRDDRSLARVRPIRGAVCNVLGTVSLFVPTDFTANTGTPRLSSVEAVQQQVLRIEEVPATSLDAFFTCSAEIGLAKIDAEGSELAVLKGAAQLLASRGIRDIIFEEYEPYPAATHQILESQGYTLFLLSGTRSGPELRPPSYIERDRRYVMPNYLATLAHDRAQALFTDKRWYCHQPYVRGG